MKDVDDFHLRSVGRALEYMIREYRDYLESVEREHSSSIRCVEDRRSEDHRVEDRRESVPVEEPVAANSSLPPPHKRSRKTKVSVCPTGGFSALSSSSDIAVAPPMSGGPAFPHPLPGVGSIVLLTIC